MGKLNCIAAFVILAVIGSFAIYSYAGNDEKNTFTAIADEESAVKTPAPADDAAKANINNATNPIDNNIPEVINKADWLTEDTYWSKNYQSSSYYQQGLSYDDYSPAYEYGVELYNDNNGKPFSELENTNMMREWNDIKGESTLTWEQARNAIRESYNRLYNTHTPNPGTNAGGSSSSGGR